MRMSLVIVVLAAIAVGLVQIRREKIRARHEIQQMRARQVLVRRRLWDQDVRIGQLTTPERIRNRVRCMGLEMVEKHVAPEAVVVYRSGE